MAIKSITFVYTLKLEIPNVTTIQENPTAHLFEFLPFAEEKAAVRYTAIVIEKPAPDDSSALPGTDEVEKAKMTGNSLLKQAFDEMAINATPEKASARNAEMAAQEDSTEMEVDATRKEDSQEKAQLAVDQHFELVITKALEKVNITSGI